MILETERLTLSKVQTTDAAFILKLLSDPAFIKNIRDEGIQTIDEANDHIRVNFIGSYQKNGFGMYLVTLKSSGEKVGLCGLVQRKTLDCPDIGYAFLAEYSGNGYAGESSIAMIQYGTHVLGIERIVGLTSLDNKASIKILEKAGLVFKQMISTDDGETMLYVPTSKALYRKPI